MVFVELPVDPRCAVPIRKIISRSEYIVHINGERVGRGHEEEWHPSVNTTLRADE